MRLCLINSQDYGVSYRNVTTNFRVIFCRYLLRVSDLPQTTLDIQVEIPSMKYRMYLPIYNYSLDSMLYKLGREAPVDCSVSVLSVAFFCF